MVAYTEVAFSDIKVGDIIILGNIGSSEPYHMWLYYHQKGRYNFVVRDKTSDYIEILGQHYGDVYKYYKVLDTIDYSEDQEGDCDELI